VRGEAVAFSAKGRVAPAFADGVWPPRRGTSYTNGRRVSREQRGRDL